MYHKTLLPIIVLSVLFIVQSCAVTSDDETDGIEKYVGTWNVSDQAARLNYNVTIMANPSNSAEILLDNFAGLGSSATGLVVGNSVVIDQQQLSTDYSVSGSGSYVNSGKLVFNFDLNDGIDIYPRVATFTK